MKRLFVLLLLALAWASPSWAAYGHIRPVTIDHTKVPTSDQTNFPVLFSGTYAYLATEANGGAVTSSSGYDIILTSDSACATKLDHEIETYTATSGLVVFWVRVPTVATATDTVIYLCYGDSGVTTTQEAITGVWDANFKGVWHVPDGTTLTGLDSTSNNNDLTLTGTPTAIAAKVDGGATVGASAKYLGATLAATGTTNTISAWVKFTSLPTASAGHHVAYAVGGGELFVQHNGSVPKFAVWGSAFAYGTTLSTGTWYYLTTTRNGTGASGYLGYLNAVLDITTTRTDADSDTPFRIGRKGNETNDMNGVVDEVRLSTSVRAASWITTEYNNMSSPSTFYTVGDDSAGATGFFRRRVQ